MAQDVGIRSRLVAMLSYHRHLSRRILAADAVVFQFATVGRVLRRAG